MSVSSRAVSSRALFELVLLGPTSDRRQLQDSPVLGDVWIERVAWSRLGDVVIGQDREQRRADRGASAQDCVEIVADCDVAEHEHAGKQA